VVENINDLVVDVGGAGSTVGTGGMVTKLTAVRPVLTVR
jgi:glutamate 5-kinase